MATGTNEDDEDMSLVMTMKGGTLGSWWVPFHWKMPGYKRGELDIQSVKTTELDSTWCYGVQSNSSEKETFKKIPVLAIKEIFSILEPDYQKP